MSKPEATDLPADSWLVALSGNQVSTMTLDELDAAFNAGSISNDTLVWTHDLDDWCALGQLLGTDDEEPGAEPAPEVLATPEVLAAPDVLGTEERPTNPRGFTAAAVVRAEPQHVVAQQAPEAVAVQTTSLPPTQLKTHGAPASISTAPVAFDPSLAVTDEDAFAPKKRSVWGFLALAAAVAGGVGFTMMNLSEPTSGVTSEDLAKAAAAQPLPVAAPDKDAPLAVGGGYQVTAVEEKAFAVEAEKAKKAKEERLVRERVAAALEGKQPPKMQRRGAARPTSRSKAPAKPAVKPEKSSFDPLNGSLP